jgi:hypothetical protein
MQTANDDNAANAQKTQGDSARGIDIYDAPADAVRGEGGVTSDRNGNRDGRPQEDKSMATYTYAYVQRNPNSWDESTGEREVVNSCGHSHRTLKAAVRCRRRIADNSELGTLGQFECVGRAVDLEELYWAKMR